MKGLRSNGTSSNVLDHDAMSLNWRCLDEFSNHRNQAFGDKFGLKGSHLIVEEAFSAYSFVLLVPRASPGGFDCLLPATIFRI